MEAEEGRLIEIKSHFKLGWAGADALIKVTFQIKLLSIQ